MRFLISLIFLLSLTLVSFAQTNWTGKYFFGEDGGETAGGSKIYIAHTIKVSTRSLDTYKIKLYSQGFQTSVDIFANGKAEDNKLHIYFSTKGKDHFTGEYNSTDLLLTLERKQIDGEEKIITHWEKFQPALDKNNKSGEVYFEKIKSEQEQDTAAKWMRIESEDKEISVAMPLDSMIDAEDENEYQKHKIQGTIDGVTMQLITYRKPRAVPPQTILPTRQSTTVKDFKLKDYVIRLLTNNDLNFKNSQEIRLYSKKNYYRLKVGTDSLKKEAVNKFLLSLKIQGESIFKNEKAEKTLADIEKTIPINELKSSPEVIASYKRKTGKNKRKVTYQEVTVSGSYPAPEEANYTKAPMIIEKPQQKRVYTGRVPNGAYEIILKTQLLANGQVGDVKVYSGLRKSYLRKCCVDAVKKMKFVPAQLNGKNVDSTYIITYRFTSFTISR